MGFILGASSGVANWPSYLLLMATMSLSTLRWNIANQIKRDASFQLLILCLVYFSVSTLWSDHPERIIVSIFDSMLILSLVTSLLYCQSVDQKFASKLLYFLLGTICILAVLGFYQYLIDRSSIVWPKLNSEILLPTRCQIDFPITDCALRDDYYRLHGLGFNTNPNSFAYILGFGVVLALLKIRDTRNWELLPLAASLPLMCFVTYLTGTKAVWLALVVTAALTFTYRRKHFWQTVALMIMVSGPIIGWLHIYGFSFSLDMLPRGSSFREIIWQYTLSENIDHILIGNGYQTESVMIINSLLTVNHPHSLFVSTIYYTGLIGFSLLVLVISRCIMNEKSSTGLILLMYSFVVFSVDGNQLVDKNQLVWLLFWLPIALTMKRSYSINSSSSSSAISIENASPTGSQKTSQTKLSFDTN